MIIATSGHVDHGKTALLQALTGTNTAHLPEEKKRGLTIDLGYAYLPIGDKTLGFIDVPGHQKFLSNMLAGLGGLQYAMLIISAEEGIKPQTSEHLAILQLLNVEIMVVITKADRAENSQIELLIANIKQQFPTLLNAAFFITSAKTHLGIEELKNHLNQLTQNPAINKPFRYAIDRVFQIKGAGLIVTGTAISGKVKINDELFLSNGKKVRVKAIHAQNTPSEIGQAGQRLALNLANIEKDDITRGDWLTFLAPQKTERITVKLNPIEKLNESSVIHLYHFASHITAKLNLLTAKQAVRNGEYFAEIILDEPLPICVTDKLILRSGDDSHTLAGAEVLEIDSPKRHKRTEQRLDLVKYLAKATAYPERLNAYLSEKALNINAVCWSEQLLPADLTAYFPLTYQQWIYSKTFKQAISQTLIEKMAEYHLNHQDQLGLSKARLFRIAALNQPENLIYAFIDELIENGKLAQTRGWVHSPDHKIEFSSDELALWKQIKPLFEQTNQALWVRDIANELSIDETVMRNLLYKAGKLGYLIPIVKDRFLLSEQIQQFAKLISQIIATQGDISVNQLRDKLGYGRKLTVQLMEYFDRCGFLRRKGNVHLLRDGDIF